MLKSFTDKLNNTNIVLNWLKQESPNAEVVFVSPAKVTESKSIASHQWHHPVSERNVIFIIAKNQLVLKNTLISPFTVFYALVIVMLLVFSIIGKAVYPLALALLGLLQIEKQLPYQRRILYEDIQKIIVDSKDDINTKLIIDTNVRVIHTQIAKSLTEQAWNIITSQTKTIINS